MAGDRRSVSPRVCFVAPGASGLFLEQQALSHGGSELQMYQYACALAETGRYAVTFIVHGDARQAPVIHRGARACFCPFVPGWRAKLWFQQALARTNADVVIQRGAGSVTKEVAFFAKWRRRRFVYWVANERDVDLTARNTSLNRNRWFQWGLRSADAIIVQSESQARALSAGYGRQGVIIPNAFPDAPGHNTACDADKAHVLWIGRFVPIKRPEMFIALAAALPEYRFLLVGPTIKGESADYLERRRVAIDRTPNLTYHPGVSFDASYALFRQALALVNTSVSEGYPNTFVQAMQTGTPIASLNFDPDGVIARHELGVAPTRNDLDSFCGRMRALLGDAGRRQACGLRARRYFEDHHLMERNAPLLEALIHDLTGV